MDRKKNSNGASTHGSGPSLPHAASSAVPSAASMGNGECLDSVSYLESAFHHGFMRLRLKTGDFVYHENSRLTRELDEFCDVDGMHTPKGPVILLGESGMGKSAFLANWLVRRKKLFQNWQSSYPEFIFSHTVGCSRQSCSVSNLLERMLREIKEYFELNKEIPDVEERLSWQFPRFLEAASKKGRVILVVDGLHRLHTNNGESILKWVPLAFPPNVRIIFSATLNYPTAKFSLGLGAGAGTAAPVVPRGDEGGHEVGMGGDYYDKTSLSAQTIERIKVEAGRRSWKLIYVLPLAEDDRWRIVKKFLHKYGGNSGQESDSAASKSASGLQLFEIQQKAIVGISMSTSPHFLRNFLLSLLWAVKEGFNIHAVFESWLGADSVGQLLESVLRSMEVGYTPDKLSTDDAMQFLSENCDDDKSRVAAEAALARRLTTSQTPTLARRVSLQRERSRSKIEFAQAAAEAAVRESSEAMRVIDFHPRDGDSSATSGGLMQMQRADSIHETRELFVNTIRADGGRTQTPAVDGGPVLASLDSSVLSSAKEGATFSPCTSLEFSQHKLKQTDAHGPANTLDRAPDYLRGGRSVTPLGDLLGRTLSLLYVSRHGLLVNELRFILNAVVTEVRDTTPLHEASGQRGATAFKLPTSKKDLAGHQLTGFSEDEWQVLLRALRTLGVLFVQEVVVLPMCKDILRDVIWWRYIGSERAEQYYHQWLIRFFRIHPTTFRRVEELPWHLKRCYQWDTLRQVLVNLPMFQLLYTANYKNELFGYWRVLTDGPLLNYGATACASDPPVYVLPFDIVREYGKSLDDWYRRARPPTKAFVATVQLITRFMHEFCLSYPSPLPQFLHAPFDLKRLYQDGFLFVEGLPHVQTVNGSASGPPSSSSTSSAPSTGLSPASPRSGAISGMGSTAATTSSALLAALDNFPPTANPSGPGGMHTSARDKEVASNCFFFYQRWVWIQFPWLALGREIVVREPIVPNPILEKASGTSGNGGSSNNTLGSLAILRGVSTNLLLLPASSRGGAGEGSDEESRRQDRGADIGAVTTAAHTPAHTLARSGLFDARFWDVKKSMFDSKKRRPRGAVSTSQLAAVKNASVMASSSPPPMTQTLDVISPENLFSKKAAYATVKTVLGSSVRSLPTAALHTSASLPTLGEERRLLANAVEATAVGGDTTATKPDTPARESLPLGGSASATALTTTAQSTAASKASLAAKSSMLDSLGYTDDLSSVATAFGLPAHFQDYPQSEWEITQSYNHRVVLKLQTLYDSVKTEVSRKQAHLHVVKRKIRETARRYELTMRECDMAKQAADEMTSRLTKLEHVVKNIARQEKTHRKLIRGCELFPACTPTHFEANRKELRLLQVKLTDLQAEKKVLHVKKAHLQSVELPALRKAVEKNKQLLSAVVDKLERARDKVAHDQAASDKLYQRRLEMIESVRTANASGSEVTLEEEVRTQARHASSAATRSLAAKVALQQCESMCEKIQKATGFSKMELILQKFVRREELNASFEEQAKLYEARLKQIKLNEAELEEQLHSLEVSQAVTSTEDPRLLEQKLRAAEVELAHTEYTHTSLLTSSKEVITGAARIVKLMGITNCSAPQQNAIPAARLWPPPVGYEGENSLTSEFDTLDPPAITALLQICQDRAILMIDAIEGARSDPDINFSLIADSPARSRRRTMRGEEKVASRMSRFRRPPHLTNVAEKKERVGFDRGAVPQFTGVGASTASGQYGSTNNGASPAQPATPEVEEEDANGEADVLSREAVKASSKSKLAQKKRVAAVPSATSAGNNVHHGSDVDHDG